MKMTYLAQKRMIQKVSVELPLDKLICFIKQVKL